MRTNYCVIAAVVLVIGCSQPVVQVEHELSDAQKERQQELLTPMVRDYKADTLDIEGDSVTQHTELLSLADVTVENGEMEGKRGTFYAYTFSEPSAEEGEEWLYIGVVDGVITMAKLISPCW